MAQRETLRKLYEGWLEPDLAGVEGDLNALHETLETLESALAEMHRDVGALKARAKGMRGALVTTLRDVRRFQESTRTVRQEKSKSAKKGHATRCAKKGRAS